MLTIELLSLTSPIRSNEWTFDKLMVLSNNEAESGCFKNSAIVDATNLEMLQA